MKILTALANENINKKLENKKNCEIIYKDIQYQEALLEILDKNRNIDVLILSSILPGELDIYELINLIKYKQENINIYIILDKQNDKLIKFLIRKGINKIFINNKITEDDLIEKILNENIKKTEKIEKTIYYKKDKNNFFDNIKIKLNKKINNYKNKKNKIKKTAKKSKKFFSILLLIKLKNNKKFFIEFNIKKSTPKKIKKIGGKKKKMKNIDLENMNYEEYAKENNITIEEAKELSRILENLKESQSKFINSDLAKAINNGIDVGLRVVLPDFIEDEIINIKNSFLREGFKEGIETVVEEATDLGKSLIGIATGTFENISQIKKAVEKGGLIDTISDILDDGIKWLKDEKIINKNTYNAIKKGKDTILDTIEKNVGESLDNQIEALEKIDGYIEKWQKYYEEQNFSGMEYQYNKIEEYLENVIPLENTLIKARQLENIHELIKNNGKNFELTEEEKELANMLIN